MRGLWLMAVVIRMNPKKRERRNALDVDTPIGRSLACSLKHIEAFLTLKQGYLPLLRIYDHALEVRTACEMHAPMKRLNELEKGRTQLAHYRI